MPTRPTARGATATRCSAWRKCPCRAPPRLPLRRTGRPTFSIDTDLDWADASGATSYDVYFGDVNPPPLAGNTATSAWALPTLAYQTTYYWKVVARNVAGSTPGPVWSFTSAAAPYLRGDLNCDGSVNFRDINPFVLRLSNPTEYFNTYPTCPDANGDIDGDGSVNFRDINPFVALLSGGG